MHKLSFFIKNMMHIIRHNISILCKQSEAAILLYVHDYSDCKSKLCYMFAPYLRMNIYVVYMYIAYEY